MSSRRSVPFTTLVLLIVFAGCGGGKPLPPPTESLSPAAPTVAVNGQVPLVLTVNGLCGTCSLPGVTWEIDEDGGGCNWTTTPPAGPCPGGTIQITGANVGISLTATYFAPSTPGTYHVRAQAILVGVAAALSTVTVTP
jgi:hypothetical protein